MHLDELDEILDFIRQVSSSFFLWAFDYVYRCSSYECVHTKYAIEYHITAVPAGTQQVERSTTACTSLGWVLAQFLFPLYPYNKCDDDGRVIGPRSRYKPDPLHAYHNMVYSSTRQQALRIW